MRLLVVEDEHSLRERLDRLTALVRTLLEMSNLQSVSRTDQIALAPLVEEILTDLTLLPRKMASPCSRTARSLAWWAAMR